MKSLIVTKQTFEYNLAVRIIARHGWDLGVTEAIALQKELAQSVIRHGAPAPRFVTGVDIAEGKLGEKARAAAVLLSFPQLELLEVAISIGELTMPYLPGLLSFREAPLILEALKKLNGEPDVIMVDGQGIAHPRRFGLASHLGLFTDKPTVGCAKSLLCGEYGAVGEETGSLSYIVDKEEIIGAALRSRTGVKPIYVSSGHLIGLKEAVELVLGCCHGYRLPEVTRMAHKAAGSDMAIRIEG